MIDKKAYGKILVFGAYSLLEPGNIGLVVNVNKGTLATVEPSNNFKINLPDFNIASEFSFSEDKVSIKNYNEKLSFVKNAIECSLRYLKCKKIPIKKFSLSLKNDLEMSPKGIKTGLGSSATCVVSSVSAILKFHEINIKDTIYKISRCAHYKAQGSGSGFDIAAAVFGSHFFVSEEAIPKDLLDYVEKTKIPPIKNYEWPSFLIPAIIFTGKSASTKVIISKILQFKKKEPKRYHLFMKKYNIHNQGLKQSFEKKEFDKIKQGLEKSWEYRKKLGQFIGVDVEPKEAIDVINKLRSNGAYTAGLAGAGGGDSILALFLDEASKAKALSLLKPPLSFLNDISLC